MATIERIRAIVDTKGVACPQIGMKLCPGNRDGKRGCAKWITEIVDDESNGRVSSLPMNGCLDAWTYIVRQDALVETIRVQAGMDKTANAVHAQVTAALSAVQTSAPKILVIPAMPELVETLTHVLALGNGKENVP